MILRIILKKYRGNKAFISIMLKMCYDFITKKLEFDMIKNKLKNALLHNNTVANSTMKCNFRSHSLN